MSYFINPVEEDQIVYVSCEGMMSASELSAMRQEVRRALDQQRWNRIMVDATQVQSGPKPLELFDIAREWSMNIFRGVRAALAVRPDQVRQASMIEKVTRHGSLFLIYFLDLEKAKAWIKQTRLRRQNLAVKELQPV